MNLQPILDLLRTRIGLDPDSLGSKTVSNAILRRMHVLSIPNPEAYLELLPHSGEWNALIESVIVPESWFFRGRGLFPFLAQYASNWIRERKSSTPFRALCIPCASGEEPYSLAIAFQELGILPESYSIEGVDLSEKSLDRARKGLYSEFAFRELSPEIRSRYFQATKGQWQIYPSIQARVRLRRENLLDENFGKNQSPFDLILCRNLMIYFTPEAREQGLLQLERILAPDGLIGVGHAEPQLLHSRGYYSVGDTGLFLFSRSKDKPKPIESAPFTWTPIPTPKIDSPTPKIQSPKTVATPVPTPSTSVDPLKEAQALADAGKIKEALEKCQQSLKQSPTVEGYYLLGLLHQSKQEWNLAGDAFRKVLYLEPDHREAMFHLMMIHEQRGETSQAEILRQRIDRQRGTNP